MANCVIKFNDEINKNFYDHKLGKLNGYSGDGNLFTQETIDTFVNCLIL